MNTNTENSLFAFAYCGKEDEFNNKLLYLANNLAEEETWDFNNKNGIDILRKYIFTTFSKCKEQNKIIYTDDKTSCAINTGLLTYNGKEILMLFDGNAFLDDFNKERASNYREWYFNGFRATSDRDFMKMFKGKVPQLATYTDDVTNFFFNPELPIEVDVDHIIDDNYNRIAQEVPLGKEIVRMMLDGVLTIAIKKAKRNFRLAIPQYYQDRIDFLLPIEFPIDDNKYTTMALAIEKLDGVYRANTIFSLEDAYAKARILMKPDTNWLLK